MIVKMVQTNIVLSVANFINFDLNLISIISFQNWTFFRTKSDEN